MAERKRVIPIIRRQEDETGFHYGVAAALPVLIQPAAFRTGRRAKAF